MNILSKNLSIFSLSLMVIFSGCAFPTTKSSRRIDIRELGVIAVMPFDGYNGAQFSDATAQEFLFRGARLVDRQKLVDVIVEQGMSVNSITKGVARFQKIGGLAGVDNIVCGSVTPIIVYASGAPSGKVSTASLKIVSVKTGEIVVVANYNANTEYLNGSVLYPEAARRLVGSILQGDAK